MMKITLAVAAVAAVLTTAPLVTPGKAQSVKMAQGVDVQVGRDRDEDCTDSSLRLMAMRTKMLRLISDRDSLGGSEPPLNVEQQLTAEHPKQSSPPSAKVLTAETRGRDI